MKNFLKCFAFMLMLGSYYTSANAFMLDEKQIFTQKKSCYINYLTEKNTSGWYIKTDREECGKEGFLSGYHRITIYNGFSKPIEYISGNFSNGYWTGDDFVKRFSFKRFSDELGVQKATFDLMEDKADNVRYIAQIVTKKTTSGAYPPFKVCNPARIMAIHPDKADFKKPEFLQRMFSHVEQQTRIICPKEQKVMLFLSTTSEPKQDDISVFVHMNLRTRKHRIIYADDVNKTPIPHAIKHEKSKTVSVFISDQVNQRAEYITPEEYQEEQTGNLGAIDIDALLNANEDTDDEILFSPANSQISEAEKELHTKIESEKRAPLKAEVIRGKNNSPATEDTVEKKSFESDNNSSSTVDFYFSEEFSSPQTKNLGFGPAQKSFLKPLNKPQTDNAKVDRSVTQATISDVSNYILPARHVFLISKVLNAPVLAQVPVHVNQIKMDNTGTVNAPVSADIEGAYLKTGWHLIKGYFIAYKKSESKNALGLIRVLKNEKCTLNICKKEKK